MAIFLVKYPKRPAREAIQLSLTRSLSAAVVSFRAPFFRITGSTVWTVHGDRYIARLTDSGWEANGTTWTGMWWHAFRIETIYQHPRVSEDASVTREQDARRDFKPS